MTEPSAASPVPEQPAVASAPPGAAEAASETDRAARALRADRLIEIAAVILLGAATLLAAWSGYQSALWNGIQSDDYVRGSGERVEGTKASTLAGQERLYDSQVFSQWLNAYVTGETRLTRIYERRFRDEFRVAFEAWLKTDPLNNPSSPPGPLFMPEYVQASARDAETHEAKAAELIVAGEDANDVSDRYVLYTVVFAAVLFLAAISDRFRWRKARIAVLAIGTALAALGALGLVLLPIA